MKIDKYIKKTQEILVIFIVFFLPLIFYGKAADPFWVVEKFIFKFSVSALLFFYIVYLLIINKLIEIKTPYNIAFFLFILINIAGIIKITNIYFFADKLITNIYCIIFSLMIAIFLNEKKINTNKIILSLILSVSIMAIYGIIQSTGFDIFSWRSNFSGRAASTLGNPNFLAGHFVLILPFVYSLVFFYFNKRKIYLISAIAFIFTYGLLITQTRGAYLAFITSIFFMGILIFIYDKETFIKNKKVLLLVFTFIFVLLISYFIFNKNAYIRVKNIILAQDEAAQIRLSLWKNSLNVFKDNFILGTGPGNFPIKYSYYQASSLNPEFFKKSDFYRSSHSHNDYIQFAAEYGIAGLGVFLFLLYLIFKSGINFLKSDNTKKIIIIGILSGITGMLIHAIFNFPFLIIPTLIYFYFFIAFLAYLTQDSKIVYYELNKEVKYIFFFILSIAILIMIFSFHSLIANVYLRQAKENEYFNKIKEAVNYALLATKIDPYYEENYLTLADLFYKTGNSSESCKCYEKIYKLNSGFWEANLNLFDCYASVNLKDKMLEIGKNLYKLSPYSKKAIRAYGLSLYINGQYQNAIDIFNQGIKLYEDDYEIITYLAVVYAANADFEKAYYFFNKAIKIKPDFKDAYLNMAVAYYSEKKYKEAKKVINRMNKSGLFDNRADNLLRAIKDAEK